MLRDPLRGSCPSSSASRVLSPGPCPRRGSGEVPRFLGGEGDRELMAALQSGEQAEVGQSLALLLGHVITVGQVRRRDRAEPLSVPT